MHLLPALKRSYRYCSLSCIRSLHNSSELLKDEDEEYVDLVINRIHVIDFTPAALRKTENCEYNGHRKSRC